MEWRSFLSFVGEGKERVADPQERLCGRLCVERGPYKFNTRFYFGQFQHFLQPLLLTSKSLLLTIIQGATFSYREGIKHRLCGPYWGMYAVPTLLLFG